MRLDANRCTEKILNPIYQIKKTSGQNFFFLPGTSKPPPNPIKAGFFFGCGRPRSDPRLEGKKPGSWWFGTCLPPPPRLGGCLVSHALVRERETYIYKKSNLSRIYESGGVRERNNPPNPPLPFFEIWNHVSERIHPHLSRCEALPS